MTHEKIAEDDLQDLGLQTGTTGEDLLHNADEEVSQRSRNKHAVKGHLRHPMAEVVAFFANILRDPGREEFLQGREDTGGKHLGTERVRLELAQVELLKSFLLATAAFLSFFFFSQGTYSEIANLCRSASQALTNQMRQLLGFLAHRLILERVLDFLLDGLLNRILQLDRHGD